MSGISSNLSMSVWNGSQTQAYLKFPPSRDIKIMLDQNLELKKYEKLDDDDLRLLIAYAFGCYRENCGYYELYIEIKKLCQEYFKDENLPTIELEGYVSVLTKVLSGFM